MKNKITLISLSLAIFAAMTGIASANPCDSTAPDFNPNYDPTKCDTMTVFYGGQQLVDGANINLPNDGTPIVLTVRITFSTNMIDNPQLFTPYVSGILSNPNGAASENDIEFNYNEITCNPPSPCGFGSGVGTGTPMNWYQSFGEGQTEDLNLEISSTGPLRARYNITLDNQGYGDPISFEAANLEATNIPEFPTIVAPIAAILGLMFFFQRRK